MEKRQVEKFRHSQDLYTTFPLIGGTNLVLPISGVYCRLAQRVLANL